MDNNKINQTIEINPHKLETFDNKENNNPIHLMTIIDGEIRQIGLTLEQTQSLQSFLNMMQEIQPFKLLGKEHNLQLVNQIW